MRSRPDAVGVWDHGLIGGRQAHAISGLGTGELLHGQAVGNLARGRSSARRRRRCAERRAGSSSPGTSRPSRTRAPSRHPPLRGARSTRSRRWSRSPSARPPRRSRSSAQHREVRAVSAGGGSRSTCCRRPSIARSRRRDPRRRSGRSGPGQGARPWVMPSSGRAPVSVHVAPPSVLRYTWIACRRPARRDGEAIREGADHPAQPVNLGGEESVHGTDDQCSVRPASSVYMTRPSSRRDEWLTVTHEMPCPGRRRSPRPRGSEPGWSMSTARQR